MDARIPKALLSTQEVAAEYGIPAATLNNLRCKGGGPEYVQLTKGGAVRYRRTAIEGWLSDHTRRNTSEAGR